MFLSVDKKERFVRCNDGSHELKVPVNSVECIFEMCNRHTKVGNQDVVGQNADNAIRVRHGKILDQPFIIKEMSSMEKGQP